MIYIQDKFKLDNNFHILTHYFPLCLGLSAAFELLAFGMESFKDDTFGIYLLLDFDSFFDTFPEVFSDLEAYLTGSFGN